MKTSRRPGFSLLEVLVATAILLGSAIVLFQLAGVGTRHAVSAEKLADAQWSCRAKLNQVLAGVTAAQRVQDRPLENHPGWVYSIQIEPIDEPGMPADLAVLRVTVTEELEDGRPGTQFALTRWIRDPLMADDADLDAGFDAGAGTDPAASVDDALDVLFDEDELP